MKRFLRFLFGPSKTELVDSLAHLDRMKVDLHVLARDVLAKLEKVKAELRASEQKCYVLENELEAVKQDRERWHKASIRNTSKWN